MIPMQSSEFSARHRGGHRAGHHQRLEELCSHIAKKKKKNAGFAVRGAPAFVGVLSVVLPTLTLSHQVDTGGKA